MVERKNPERESEGPHTKLTTYLTALGVAIAYLALAYAAHWWPFSPNHGPTPTPPVSSSCTNGCTYLSDLQPGSVNSGDFKVGTQQINRTTYPNSVRLACGADWFVTYPARGYKVLTAVVGVPDDNASVAAGSTVTVTFAPMIGNVAAARVSVSPGQSQSVTVNLPGSVQGGESQMEISCSVSPSTADGVEVALGNAALS